MSDHIEVKMAHGGTVRGTPEAVALALNIQGNMQTEQALWIADLRSKGVKAAHPDDGWVDRKNNTVSLEYPQFNDCLAPGDLLALGWPWRGHETRIVRVTGRVCISTMFNLWRWTFVEVE